MPNCPFTINADRMLDPVQSLNDHWPTGFFLEVFVHASSEHPFWLSDLLVDLILPLPLEIRDNVAEHGLNP